VHVHLREPGGEHKEDLTTGTAAALAGGVTQVLDMPNTYPPIVDRQTLDLKQDLAEQKALCDVGFFIGATETNASRASALSGDAVGLKIYLDQTYGPLRIQDPAGSKARGLAALVGHVRTWPVDRPIAVHAEGLSAAMAIGLAWSYGRHVHLCHVSLADEIALIRAAKTAGARLTCEVSPHHLFLTESDARRLGPYGSMKPPLATEADRQALWANLDVIDCIATDHAPHAIEEKQSDTPPPGVPGLETMLPLLLNAVAEGRLSLEQLVNLTHDAPRRVFGLPPQPDTWVEVDPGGRRTLGRNSSHTKCRWTPFEGWEVQGLVERVVLRGQTVFERGEIRAAPGFGRVIKPITSRD
jgi:carbamoyl-phosphate synthase/aspartate carbamoyltransferase/dihydroorotase